LSLGLEPLDLDLIFEFVSLGLGVESLSLGVIFQPIRMVLVWILKDRILNPSLFNIAVSC